MPTRTRYATVIVLAVLGLPGAGPARDKKAKDESDLPPLNRKVVDFAQAHRGEKVADGQCTALATEALREAGAKRFPFHGTGGDYVWGRPVPSFREAIPGDIVQFRDAVFRGRASLSGHRSMTWHQEYSHHTAIVAEIRAGGKIVIVLHQNVGPTTMSVDRRQTVTETTLRVDSLQKGGQVWIYRPLSADDSRQTPTIEGAVEASDP